MPKSSEVPTTASGRPEMLTITAERFDEVGISVEITRDGLTLADLVKGLNGRVYQLSDNREQIVDAAGSEVAYVHNVEEIPVGTAYEDFQT